MESKRSPVARWKAVVVGSYERGDRAVTVQKLAELADFYGVPGLRAAARGRCRAEPARPDTEACDRPGASCPLPKEKAGALARYAATIQSQRGDYNGKVLSIRQEDLRSLAVIYDKSPSELTEELISWGVLDAEARRAVESFATTPVFRARRDDGRVPAFVFALPYGGTVNLRMGARRRALSGQAGEPADQAEDPSRTALSARLQAVAPPYRSSRGSQHTSGPRRP